jgi:hypothetical protein
MLSGELQFFFAKDHAWLLGFSDRANYRNIANSSIIASYSRKWLICANILDNGNADYALDS